MIYSYNHKSASFHSIEFQNVEKKKKKKKMYIDYLVILLIIYILDKKKQIGFSDPKLF